jgi:hypothetical protein
LAAAIYNSQSKIVQVIGGLPDAARVIYEFDASNLTSPATHMAVSDDGTIVLVQFASDVDMGFLGFDSSGASWRILLDRPSAATFFANSHDAILADNATSTVFIISDVARTAVQVPLISTLGKLDAVSAVMVSTDNRQVFAADASSGNVLIVDVQTRTAVSVPCQCRLTGLSRLKGNSMVRLNEPSEETMGALDASSANPRIWVTPPATSSTNRPQ